VSIATTCWKCATQTGNDVACHACGYFQPFPETLDYFQVMRVPRRMKIDADALRARFYELSRKLHPDNFAAATPDEVAIATRNAAVLNQAYRTLREPLARAEYLLERLGGKADAPPDPAFLMEMMEVGERIEDAAAADARADLEHDLEDFRGRVRGKDQELEAIFADWDALGEAPDAAARTAIADQLRTNLGVRKYYKNIIRDITQTLGA